MCMYKLSICKSVQSPADLAISFMRVDVIILLVTYCNTVIILITYCFFTLLYYALCYWAQYLHYVLLCHFFGYHYVCSCVFPLSFYCYCCFALYPWSVSFCFNILSTGSALCQVHWSLRYCSAVMGVVLLSLLFLVTMWPVLVILIV